MPHIMVRILRVLGIILLLILLIVGWFWWNRPTRVDMAAYVPADSLVYLESNSLVDIAAALAATESWQKLRPKLSANLPDIRHTWSTDFVRITGLGSTPTVVATRAQVAFVMLDLSAKGAGDELEFKSEAALVIETHTSQSRIKPAFESMLRDFATRAYGQPRFEQINLEGNELWRWTAPDDHRRIVAAVEDSLVVIGNSEKAVNACLSSHHGQRPSLLHRPELDEMRARLTSRDTLAFGYVSAGNAAKLISEAAPIVVGRLSQQEQFQKLISTGATKLVGNVGWSARPYNGGIEDNYFIGAKPELLARLRPAFTATQTNFQGGWELLPANVHSVTSYNIRDPATAWDTLNATISSQLDVVSAVVFTTAFRALWAPYGIDDPDTFLKAVKPDLLTVRLEPQSERALIIAGVASQDTLRQFVSRRFGRNARSEKIGDVELTLSEDEGFAASFAGDYFLLGAPDDVRRCLKERLNQSNLISSPAKLDFLSHYFLRPGSNSIITFSKDTERARALFTTLASLRQGPRDLPADIDQMIDALPYAVTESTLSENGIERRTRSDFGQFASFISFLTPQQPSNPATPSR